MADIENGQKLRDIAYNVVMELVDDGDTAKSIIEEAVVNLPLLKEELISSLKEKDLELATRTAHSIKGVMSTLGLHDESDNAKECETALKNGSNSLESSYKEKLFSSIDDFAAA